MDRIIVDADASPVNNIVLKQAQTNQLDLIFVIDNSHVLNPEYGQVIVVDKGADSADFKILSLVKKGDLVVTQDYELSSLVLSKGGLVININGFEVNDFNIQTLMNQRYLNQKARKAKVKTTNPKKRTQAINDTFEQELVKIINRELKR